MRDNNATKTLRTGATIVEFALVIPILVLTIFAGIEFARMNMVRHTMANASYAACRHVIVPGATAKEARERAIRVLRVAGITDANIQFTPNQIAEDTAFVTTRVIVPLDSNSFGLGKIFRGKQLDIETTLRTERSPAFSANHLPTITNPPPPPPNNDSTQSAGTTDNKRSPQNRSSSGDGSQPTSSTQTEKKPKPSTAKL